MARPLRLEFAGALYHVTSRGDGREDIFRAVGDQRVFVDVLADQTHADRDQAIKAAYASGGYTMQEIGDYFALHQSRISKIVRGVPRRSGEE